MELRLYEWTYSDYCNLVDFLKAEADTKYRDFHSVLIPNTSKNEIIGIRMPKLREIGKEIAKGNIRSYLDIASSNLYEEKMLRGIVTGLLKTRSFEEFTRYCDAYVKIIDNWALCDCFCSGLKQVKKYKAEFFEYLQKYLGSDNFWAVRVALVIMLNYYLEDEYIDKVFERCNNVNSDEYYVKMAQAWLVSAAVPKFSDKTLDFLRSNSFDNDTFSKTIQKCVESKRVDDDTKEIIRSLKKS